MLSPSYLIKEQSYDQGATAGRVADLGPALDRWSRKPFLGSGFGTTVADPNAPKESEQQILDDQWLGSLLEIGAVGVLALLVALRRARSAGSRAWPGARTGGDDGWLATALAASLISFARRHAHLRRVRVHPGDVPRLRDVRLRAPSRPARAAAAPAPRAGSARSAAA